MIFVTVGNGPPYNRLLAEIDQIALLLNEPVFAQTGHSDYLCKNIKSIKFLDNEQMRNSISEALVVITHGGWGTISECLMLKKRVVAVPRQIGIECNHSQDELVKALETNGYLLGVYEINRLHETLIRAQTFEFKMVSRGDGSKIINKFLYETFGNGPQ